VEQLRRAGTTPNGVFGVKLMWGYFGEVVGRLATLTDLVDASPPEILAAAFPGLRYVRLTRRDKVRQGISWYRAAQTQRWRSTDAGVEGVGEPAFDFPAIDGLVELAAADDRAWQIFFDSHGIEPLTIVYEELEHDPERACWQILDFLGVSAPARDVQPVWRHQRQADGLTEAWVQRFLAMRSDGPG
jgi:LPS sulfotransferase NodH